MPALQQKPRKQRKDGHGMPFPYGKGNKRKSNPRPTLTNRGWGTQVQTQDPHAITACGAPASSRQILSCLSNALRGG